MPFVLILSIAPIAAIAIHYLDARSSNISDIKLIVMMLVSIVIIYVVK